MMLSCIIIEDLMIAAAYLRECCVRHGHIEVLATCTTLEEAITVLRTQKADLLFLDVEMPDGQGFSLLEQLDYHPQVIFTTNKKEYAYEAFEYHATDFLKKPFTYERFSEAVKKAIHLHQSLHESAGHLFVKADGALIRLPVKEILYVESMGDYVRLVTAKRKYLSHHTIKGIYAELPSAGFLKIHRSYIVNKEAVTAVKEQSLYIDEQELPVSKANRALVKRMIGNK